MTEEGGFSSSVCIVAYAWVTSLFLYRMCVLLPPKDSISYIDSASMCPEFLETYRTILIFSSTKCHVFHNIIFLVHTIFMFYVKYVLKFGDRSSAVVEVLRYKSEGCWFNPRWCHGFFIDVNPSLCTVALGSTQPLTEMSTRCISWG
jgi:hypothetical protein